MGFQFRGPIVPIPCLLWQINTWPAPTPLKSPTPPPPGGQVGCSACGRGPGHSLLNPVRLWSALLLRIMIARIFLLPFLVAGVFAQNNSTVKVTVFYESLCPDSIKFFTDELIPTYTQGNNFMNITASLNLVPFGNATYLDKNYTCQHGQNECLGNTLHGCAIKYLNNDTKMLLNYIGCLMGNSTTKNETIPYPDPDQVCMDKAGNLLKNITHCYKSTEENMSIISRYQNMTNSFFTNHSVNVPFISFNDIYNSNISGEAQKDLKKTLCSQVGLTNDFCTNNSKGGATMLSASLALVSALLFSFYVSQ